MQSNTKVRSMRGFTLLELSLVMVLVLLIASSLLALLRQQVFFFSWLRSQDFIAEEAPLINSMVTRIFSHADVFRIYGSLNAIQSGDVGVTTNGRAMLLGFSQGDGTVKTGAIVYEAGSEQLVYYNLDGTNVVSSWVIASGIAGASFDVVDATMQLTLRGDYGGEITYAATPSL